MTKEQGSALSAPARTMCAKVFFIDGAKNFDTADAARFGETVFLNTFASPLNVEAYMQNCIHELDTHRFDINSDFIALTGRTLQVSLFLAAITRTWEAQVKLLVFDARTGKYIERDMLTNTPEQPEQ